MRDSRMRIEPLSAFFEDLWKIHTTTIDGAVSTGFMVIFTGQWVASWTRRDDWFLALGEAVGSCVLMVGLQIRARMAETGAIQALNFEALLYTAVLGAAILSHDPAVKQIVDRFF